jgi:enoyl-CoA hydratase/carnithine racemase
MPSTLTVERATDGVTVLRLERPERLNAINEVMLAELRDALAKLPDDRDTRVVVLTGTGRGFCSGIDMRDFGASMLGPDDPAIDRLRFQEAMASLPQLLRALPQPVLAAVNGPAVGGGFALALASDVRLCSRSASFGNAAIAIGLSGAEMGMSYLLPRIVGTSVASDWMLTGRTVDADEALRSGLVSNVVDDAELLRTAIDLANQIAAHSALGVQLTKRALQANVDAPDLATAIELENRNQVITHATDEAAAARQRWADR